MRFTMQDFLAKGFAQSADGSLSKQKADLQARVTTAARPLSGKEHETHEAIIKFLRDKRFPFVHSRMDLPSTTALGTPDFIIALPRGITLWLEVKTSTGKLSSQQFAFLHWLQSKGHHALVVRSMPEFLSVVEALLAHAVTPADNFPLAAAITPETPNH